MSRNEKADPEDYRYMRAYLLVEQLDYYVKDPGDQDYLLLKHFLSQAAHKAENPNPFDAGRPKRFSDEEKIEIYKRRFSDSLTYRQIGEEYDCSPSLAYRAVMDGMYLARKKR